MKKLVIAWFVVIALCMSAAAAEARVFEDSLGRQVELAENIERVAITGPLAQYAVFPIAADMLVGVSSSWDDATKAFIPEEYQKLPVLGQLYGGKTGVNLEELLAADPQVVIDVGQAKEGLAEDLDALSEQTGVPYVHISMTLKQLDETYLKLGELLGRPDEAALIADYCTNVYTRTVQIAESVKKENLLYVTGLEGLNVIARDSYHSEVIDLLSNNLAVVESPSARGTGNEVDMEQILAWNPDMVIFAEKNMYDAAPEDPLWQAVTAVREKRYFRSPVGPYNWMGFPPSVQQLLGMTWMAKALYPQAADYDLYEETKQYFKMFYHCDLTHEAFDVLMVDSL